MADGSKADGLGIAGYTQNFFVVYTPVEEHKQTLYILSDNDPYADNSITKRFAIPKSTEEADKSGTDYFKVQGESGNPLIDDGEAYNAFNASNSYSNGNQNNSHHTPSVDLNNDPLTLGLLPVYLRAGHYIDKATYEYKDQAGKNYIVTINVNLTNNFDPSNTWGNGVDITNAMLEILGFLTSGYDQNGKDFVLSDSNSSFTISINGLAGAKIYTDDQGATRIKIPADLTWNYDNTAYNNKENIDPSPQIIKLHYATFPLTDTNIQIHYIDVDQIAPMTEDDINSEKEMGINLDSATNKYSYTNNGGTELSLNDDGTAMIEGDTNVVTIDINRADQMYDNTDKDDYIVSLLKKQGYIVVQRDKQTRGIHQYDPYSSDASNGSLDGNSGSSASYMGFLLPTQNYYVYLKKAHKINYQVLVEDENGNIESTLTTSTELGEGPTNETVATALVDPDDTHSETFAQKYQGIINELGQNYNVILHDSTSTILKKSDTLDGLKFEGTDPQLVTIYVTHKKGNVTVHYIDVNGSNKTSNYSPTDGKELTDHVQAITNMNYGEKYNNSVWDYASDHYVLASDIPATATSGIISKPNDDIYIYLKHATTTTTQTATLHENIKYQYNDGKSAGDDYNRTINYSRTQTHDLVDNTDSAWSEWKPEDNQEFTSFENVKSKAIQGYTADKLSVPAPTPADVDYENGKTHNYNYTVVYSPNVQKITVYYIDDTTGNKLETKELSGNSDAKSGYTTKNSISDYEKQNYVLVTDDTNGDKLVFDHNDKVDQVYYVHLKHRMTPINESKTIKETIHYVYEDGTKAHDDFTGVPVTFIRDGERDEVTEKEKWNDWKSKKDSFDAVTSPEILGYTPDIELVSEISVKPTDSDIVRKVTYRADEQKAILRFYDDTDQKFIEVAPDIDATGKSNGNINFNIRHDFSNYDFVVVAKGDDPKNRDSKLSGKDLSSVDYGKFDTDKNTDQHFIAHFTHKTEPVEDTKTVTETVHYVYKDGTKAHNDVQKQVSFTKSGVKDLVTGIENSSWSEPQFFEEIISPEIEGYTPDYAKIDKVIVDHNSKDIEKTVVYSADKPVTPEEPTKPTTPEVPSTPEEPTKPTTPEVPSTPEEPTKPTTPEVPSTPEEPTKPTTPEVPSTPEEPTKPTTPEVPSTPEEPTKPTTPEVPSTPEETVKPSEDNKDTPVQKDDSQPREKQDSTTKSTQAKNETVSTVTTKTSQVHNRVAISNNYSRRETVRNRQISRNARKLPQTGEKNTSLGLAGLALGLGLGLLGITDGKRKRRR